LSIYLWVQYNPDGPQWQFQESAPIGGGVNWALGIDGIALLLIVLTAFLMPICIGASWRAIEKRVPEYMGYFLLMDALIMGSFSAQDLFLFYIFFEGGLIPMYFIIGIWGGAERIKASYKFFLYTLAGSVLMLIAMLYMAGVTRTELRKYQQSMRQVAADEINVQLSEVGLDPAQFNIFSPQVSATRAIEQIAKRTGSQLIVVGSSRFPELKRFFIGSVSNDILRGGQHDVLLVSPMAARRVRRRAGAIAADPKSTARPQRSQELH